MLFYVYIVALLIVVALSTRQLLGFYAYFISLLSIPASLSSNQFMIEALSAIHRGIEPPPDTLFSSWGSALKEILRYTLFPGALQDLLDDGTKIVVLNTIAQFLFSAIVIGVLMIHAPNHHSRWLRFLPGVFTAPSILVIFGFSGFEDILRKTTVISAIVPAVLVVVFLWSEINKAFRVVMTMYRLKRQFIANFGLHPFLEAEWVRLRVPSLLRTFWLLRMSQQLIVAVWNMANMEIFKSAYAWSMIADGMIVIIKSIFTRGCETFLAVLGMASIISSVCHYIGAFFHLILTADVDEEEKSVSFVSAGLFLILAVQSGLTSLEPE